MLCQRLTEASMTMTHNKVKHMTYADAGNRLSAFTEEARARLKKRGGEILAEAQGQGERAIKSSRGWVIKNPGLAVGCAFLVGAVTTAMIRRRRTE